MAIEVHRASPNTLKSLQSRFALQRDNWNDYQFYTLYHLHYRHGKEPTDVTYIGGVKILKRGQTKGEGPLIREAFLRLGPQFVSVGTSLDYYQRLNDLPDRRRAAIMRALNDAVAHPELVEQFEKESGWTTSVFRDNSDWRAFLVDATVLFKGNFSALPNMGAAFSFTPPGSDNAIVLDFSSPEPPTYMGGHRRVGPSRTPTLLPDRIIVLVGRNGSGKSTLLSRIAHVAFASPLERAKRQLKALGVLDPPSIGFMRIIAISYSAFDSFVIPGLVAKDLSQIKQDIEKGDSRFVFCGLRDVVAEAQDDVDEATQDSEKQETIVERRTSTRLKSVDMLAREFARLLRQIQQEEATDLFKAALEPLLGDPSFVDLREQTNRLFDTSREARRIFLSWSTGHKIALHVVASLVANARPRSLVLFDEPEAHLHPPLAAALMHAVRLVLTEVNAFCIVATHSPVLLQETLARHVRIVDRLDDQVSIALPALETFGENVGVLSYGTFGLTASSTDFHKVLDLLAKGCDTIEEIDGFFTPGLSAQARAYVLSRLAAKGDDD